MLLKAIKETLGVFGADGLSVWRARFVEQLLCVWITYMVMVSASHTGSSSYLVLHNKITAIKKKQKQKQKKLGPILVSLTFNSQRSNL